MGFHVKYSMEFLWKTFSMVILSEQKTYENSTEIRRIPWWFHEVFHMELHLVFMEFLGFCPWNSMENLPWNFHEKFFMEIFYGIPWSINLGPLLCRIARFVYLLTYLLTQHTSLLNNFLRLMRCFNFEKNTIVYAICIRFNSLRYAILTDLHLNNVVINVV